MIDCIATAFSLQLSCNYYRHYINQPQPTNDGFRLIDLQYGDRRRQQQLVVVSISACGCRRSLTHSPQGALTVLLCRAAGDVSKLTAWWTAWPPD